MYLTDVCVFTLDGLGSPIAKCLEQDRYGISVVTSYWFREECVCEYERWRIGGTFSYSFEKALSDRETKAVINRALSDLFPHGASTPTVDQILSMKERGQSDKLLVEDGDGKRFWVTLTTY